VALEVVWAAAAVRDRKAILRYWSQRNGSITYSRKLYHEWEAVIRLISYNPYLGRPTDLAGVRVKLVGVYNIFYELEEDRVYIVRIIDGRRDLGKMKIS
jgi:plasmid stabilization system protein ParE